MCSRKGTGKYEGKAVGGGEEAVVSTTNKRRGGKRIESRISSSDSERKEDCGVAKKGQMRVRGRIGGETGFTLGDEKACEGREVERRGLGGGGKKTGEGKTEYEK